ncbi:putative toxin-antitoxin system toxin component, PIN family [Thiothrix unzii]|jgi:putative PIN family toxin of toxin-antitoxin system|uniref:Putative toxin-antitoxin system toxin component, PIN family n=1 Tax=Thiothrix lacustris TaxID=525917 RepID=A0A1Y1QK16_9GAMM|nr:putative toxin-antitoxin system toxin component, PIN family [Thiothrix unzii]MDX9988028.1 putative toxin-antitoxin system toxin component, PIN family [Thiothrix unzii]OQX07591.1 MAG: putative toxin-antitoxin system toxin component, PIN family [Thiothrix lacustris]
MKVERAVVDTNVLLSASISPQGTAALLVRFLVSNGTTLLFSTETFDEFETRLWRPKFDVYVSIERRKEILGDFAQLAVWVEITGKASYSRDPDDDKFVEVALVGQADVLVSGDSDLTDLVMVGGIPILSPRQCWERIQH